METAKCSKCSPSQKKTATAAGWHLLAKDGSCMSSLPCCYQLKPIGLQEKCQQTAINDGKSANFLGIFQWTNGFSVVSSGLSCNRIRWYNSSKSSHAVLSWPRSDLFPFRRTNRSVPSYISRGAVRDWKTQTLHSMTLGVLTAAGW